MVKVRDDLPKNHQGEIDIKQWLVKFKEQNLSIDKQKLKKNSLLSENSKPFEDKDLQALEKALTFVSNNGGYHLTSVNETCLHQALITIEILTTLDPDIDTLLAAALFFVAYYGKASSELIRQEFGDSVYFLVEGLIELTAQSNQLAKSEQHFAKIPQQADNLRKMLLAVAKDVRVVLIKLAERLAKLRFALNLDQASRYKLALATREIYAPLANRLGIGQIKWELEDYAFRFLEPVAYKNVAKLIDEKRLAREQYILDLINIINQELNNVAIDAYVTGRVKHIYSIWRKMHRKNIDFKDLYDVRAIRIFVDRIPDCYAVLGIIHSLWQHIPREFDDYIATPKENGYRSLHTAVIGPEGKTVEIQIRTHQMHMEAELGVAAHWAYKEGGKLDSTYLNKLRAVRRVIDWSKSDKDSDSKLEQKEDLNLESTLRQEMNEDRIYVFTPQGEIIDLPNGATSLDFAYYIHTDLGHRCRGAKINGSIKPLTYKLHSGEQVEIIAKNEGAPSRDWLNLSLGYINTERAKSKIHSWFKRQAKEDNIISGKEILDREAKRVGCKNKDHASILEDLKLASLDDMYALIGSGDLKIGHVINLLHHKNDPVTSEFNDLEVATKNQASSPTAKDETGVTIQGIGNLLSHFARCCKPVPGDPIIGYITQGRGVTIHRQDCIKALEHSQYNEHRLIQVNWGEKKSKVYPVDVKIYAYDRQGLLSDITNILTNAKVNVMSIKTNINKDNVSIIELRLQIPDLSTLGEILNRFLQLPNIIDAIRAS